jgi:hypothetical protein
MASGTCAQSPRCKRVHFINQQKQYLRDFSDLRVDGLLVADSVQQALPMRAHRWLVPRTAPFRRSVAGDMACRGTRCLRKSVVVKSRGGRTSGPTATRRRLLRRQRVSPRDAVIAWPGRAAGRGNGSASAVDPGPACRCPVIWVPLTIKHRERPLGGADDSSIKLPGAHQCLGTEVREHWSVSRIPIAERTGRRVRTASQGPTAIAASASGRSWTMGEYSVGPASGRYTGRHARR